MSLARQFAAAGQAATAPFEEESVTNLRTNRKFRAKTPPISDIELLTELSLDNREACMVHTTDRAAVDEIGDRMEYLQFLGSKFQILKRSDNPASLHVDFVAVKGVPGKDDWV